MKTTKEHEVRSLATIAREIKGDWKQVSPYAKPYLDAMAQLNGIKDMFFCDSAESVVLYFLSNAQGWRGDVAKRVKRELKVLCGIR